MKRPENVKRLHTFLDESIHRQMRIQSVREGKSLREFIEFLAVRYFKEFDDVGLPNELQSDT